MTVTPGSGDPEESAVASSSLVLGHLTGTAATAVNSSSAEVETVDQVPREKLGSNCHLNMGVGYDRIHNRVAARSLVIVARKNEKVGIHTTGQVLELLSPRRL